MTTNAVRGGDATPRPSPAALPIEIPYRGRLSWDLGTRVVEELDADRLSRWRGDGGWTLAVFCATEETIVVRFRTPIGRELFYSAEGAIRPIIASRLESARSWRQVD